MELKPYKEMIKLSKDKLNEVMAPARAKVMEHKAHMEKAKIEENILDLKAKIQEIVISKDIDFPKLLDTLDEIALLKRRMDDYDKVVDQLFPKKKKK